MKQKQRVSGSGQLKRGGNSTVVGAVNRTSFFAGLGFLHTIIVHHTFGWKTHGGLTVVHQVPQKIRKFEPTGVVEATTNAPHNAEQKDLFNVAFQTR